MKILCMDDPTIELDAYRLPDGDPVISIGSKAFRFCNGSQPFEQSEIYKCAAKLVDCIIEYKSHGTYN